MKAALDWQIAMGADEAILDAPVDRYSLPEAPPKSSKFRLSRVSRPSRHTSDVSKPSSR